MLRAFVVLIAAGLCAYGQDLCRNGLFADDQGDLRPARISGSEPVNFYVDTKPGCPQKGAECRKENVAAAGTEVLVSKIHNGFACAWQTHDAVGWLPATRVDLSMPVNTNPPLSAWSGDWKFFDNHLVISVAPDGRRLHVSGHAFWHGMDNTHEGRVEFDAAAAGNHVAYKEPQTKCEVRMTLVSGRLVATDNRFCGGMNVTFSGVYELAHQPFQTQSASTLKYGINQYGQDTVDITNVAFELVQPGNERRLILRKTHTEANAIEDMGNDAKITVEAWPLGVNPKEKPLYKVTMDGEDATVVDDALLVFDRTGEPEWWSVYHLETGRPFFDTYAPLARFSITDEEQTERYAGLEISNDDTRDKRLKARGVVGLVTYASADRVIRQATITCDSNELAQLLRSLADTTFELAAVGKAIRVTLTPFQSPATVITIPVVNDDLDLAHARVPAGIHLAAWQR